MPQRARASTYLFFAALCAALVFLSHATLLEMPYFWDEVGSTIPQAQEIHAGRFTGGLPPASPAMGSGSLARAAPV